MKIIALHHIAGRKGSVYYNDGKSDDFIHTGTLDHDGLQRFGPLAIQSSDDTKFSFQLSSLCHLCVMSHTKKFPFTVIVMAKRLVDCIVCTFVLSCNHEGSIQKSIEFELMNGSVVLLRWRVMCPTDGQIDVVLSRDKWHWKMPKVEFPSEDLKYSTVC